MNKILLSIRPEWVCKILNKVKTIEIRKSIPKCELPCEVYIYCTKGKPLFFETGDYDDGDCSMSYEEYVCLDSVNQLYGDEDLLNGKVVAKFTLNKIDLIDIPYPAYFNEVKNREEIEKKSCLDLMYIHHYLKNKRGYGWNIDDLEIFNKPKELKDFNIKKAPQSWCYIKEVKSDE